MPSCSDGKINFFIFAGQSLRCNYYEKRPNDQSSFSGYRRNADQLRDSPGRRADPKRAGRGRRRGLLLFIATGRHRCDLNNLGDLAFDGYVTLNGQYCYDARGVIYRRSIDPNDIRTAVGLIEREPFPCLFIEEDRMYINCADDNFRAAQRLLNFGDPPSKARPGPCVPISSSSCRSSAPSASRG